MGQRFTGEGHSKKREELEQGQRTGRAKAYLRHSEELCKVQIKEVGSGV